VPEEMSWDQLIERAERRHFVQFYGNDAQALAGNVALYLAEGLARGEGLVVVATPKHYELFLQHLTRVSERVRLALRENAIVFVSAAELLAKIVAGGGPQWSVFEPAVREALRLARGAQTKRKVRAYGEMVGLLWEEGRRAEAEQLEDFWNRLFATEFFELYCAYPIDVFGGDFQLGSVDTICCNHTHVVPARPDDGLEEALERGMHEVLGSRLEPLRVLMKSNFRPAWAALPKGESVILWLRNNLPEQAEQILARAHTYYKARTTAAYTRDSG